MHIPAVQAHEPVRSEQAVLFSPTQVISQGQKGTDSFLINTIPTVVSPKEHHDQMT